MTDYMPIMEGHHVLKGFIGGSLIILGILGSFGLIASAVLILLGLFVFLDCIFRYGGDIHLMSTVGGFVLGLIIGGILSLMGFAFIWLVVSIVLLLVLYAFVLKRRLAG